MKLYFSLILTIAFIACSTKTKIGECPDRKLEGSLELNSPHIEKAPSIFDGKLYFLQKYIDSDGDSELLSINLSGLNTSTPIQDFSLNFPDLQMTSTPSFFYNESTGFTEVYFSAINIKQKDKDQDIYYCYGANGKYNYPIALSEEINSKFDEMDPSISTDGNSLVFTSNRNGKDTGNDIYYASKTSEIWSFAVKFGSEINTNYDEEKPYFSENNDIYFSSSGYTEFGNFDIIKARYKGNSKWDYGELLPYPFNTEFDEFGVALRGRDIFISSNREGGCGELDLYNFERCKPGILKINIYSKYPEYSAVGKIEIYQNDDLLNVSAIDEKGLEIQLEPGKYYFEFTSKCITNATVADYVEIKCDEEYKQITNLEIAIPRPEKGNFSFEEYNIPFFVGGYYMPNTSHNLEDLKLKFKYNQMDADSVSFVENPQNKYDESSEMVDEALGSALTFLENKVNNLSSECANSDEIVKVQVVGFADPRPLGKNSKYFGPTINDERFGLKVQNGAEIDNKLLSKLRAYYTAKYFEQELERNPNYDEVSFRFIWQIKGLGVDPYQGTTYDYNRRVKISIESIVN